MAAAMSQDMETVVRSLKGNHFSPVEFVEEADNATQVVLDMIPLSARFASGTIDIRTGIALSFTAKGGVRCKLTV